MYQYRIIQQTGTALKRIVIAALVLLAALLLLELARLYALLNRLHPIAGWTCLGVFALAACYGAWRWFTFVNDHDTLDADELPPPEAAKPDDLRNHCRYLARVLRRLSRNGYLTDEHQRVARQTAYDLDETLAHRPTIEDLTRAIINAEQRVIADLHAHLDTHAQAMIRDKTIAVVADVTQPPFPVVNSLVVLYHEITITAAITGVYVSTPALTEYAKVLRDIWQVMTRGDFIRIGQALFAGVYANCPPMGRGVEDLGQAISCIWLTRSVSHAASQRCKTLRRWTVPAAIADMDAHCQQTLAETRETLIADILPLLRTAFHHKVPRADGEAPTFISNLVTGITKAVDIVIASHKTQPLAETFQRTRRTEHGTNLDLQPGYVVHRERSRRRRSGHGHTTNSLRRLLRTIAQRIKYTSRHPRS